MHWLAALLLALAVVQLALYWWLLWELEEKDEEIAGLYRQLIEYVGDDEHLLDLLWERAETEMAQARASNE